jgi:hypothetical protein
MLTRHRTSLPQSSPVAIERGGRDGSKFWAGG